MDRFASEKIVFSENFIYKKTKDTGVIVPIGQQARDFRGMVTLNETGCFLVELLQKGTTRGALVEALLAEYAVERADAERDVDAFLAKMKEAGLLGG